MLDIGEVQEWSCLIPKTCGLWEKDFTQLVKVLGERTRRQEIRAVVSGKKLKLLKEEEEEVWNK